MYKLSINFLAVLLITKSLLAQELLCKFEGILGKPVEQINNMNAQAQLFMPYNPVIVEIGAFKGLGTAKLAETYPYGKIFAFEPHPESYAILKQNMQAYPQVSAINLAVSDSDGFRDLWGVAEKASLLRKKKGNPIRVCSVVLNEWCKNNNVDHIDCLRLDTGGLEFSILKSSPEILQTVLVIIIKTYIAPVHKSILSYPYLKAFLEEQGFSLISHWYEEHKEGEAVFIRKNIYDALFN